jgi:DNA polymerase III epsilon subunit-like protein
MTRLIFVDCETGGLDAQNSALLQLAFVVWEDGIVSDPWALDIQPSYLEVSDAALAVNQIDLATHTQHALCRRDARDQIIRYLVAERETHGRPMLAGHNVGFDRRFLEKLLYDYPVAEGERVHELVHHRTVDTMAIVPFLVHAGIIDLEGGSLEQVLAHFKIENEAPHTAFGDAHATARLYTEMLLLVNDAHTTKVLRGEIR